MNTTTLKNQLLNKEYNHILLDIYIDETMIDYQIQRYVKAIEKFEELYGVKEVEIYSTPGRSEVSGNHTDHQLGKVIAAAINLDCIAIVEKTNTNIIKVVSDQFDIAAIHTQDTMMKEEEKGTSESLIKGVANKYKELGYGIGGFNAYMTSDVLIGAGLSSSAAFEVIIGTILSGLYNDMSISPVEIAKIGQYAENIYFGKPSGLMDQTACSVGAMIHIDFKEKEKPVVSKIDIDFSQFHHSLCIVDTKGSHADLTPEYAAIPLEMKKVANFFSQDVLTKVDEKEFYQNMDEVRKQCGDRAVLRAIHLFEENKRVDQAVEALNQLNFELFKSIITDSGNSSFKYLQNVYTNIDVQHQNVSIALAISEKVLNKKGACRVHGGGFAGTIQAFVPDDMVNVYKDTMENAFGEDSCHVLKIRKYGGMKVI